MYIHIQSSEILKDPPHEAACVAVRELSWSVLRVGGSVGSEVISTMPSPVLGTLVFIMCLCKCLIQSSWTDNGPWKTRSQNLRREGETVVVDTPDVLCPQDIWSVWFCDKQMHKLILVSDLICKNKFTANESQAHMKTLMFPWVYFYSSTKTRRTSVLQCSRIRTKSIGWHHHPLHSFCLDLLVSTLVQLCVILQRQIMVCGSLFLLLDTQFLYLWSTSVTTRLIHLNRFFI